MTSGHAVASNWLLLASGAFIALQIIRRARRLMTRQRLRPARQWLALVALPLLLLALLADVGAHPLRAACELAGIGAGIVAGACALRRMRFEVTDAGLFFTPFAPVGLALALLLAARVGWHLYEVWQMAPALAAAGDGQAPFSVQPITRSPLTLFIAGTLAGYYARVAFGLLRWQRGVARH